MEYKTKYHYSIKYLTWLLATGKKSKHKGTTIWKTEKNLVPSLKFNCINQIWQLSKHNWN